MTASATSLRASIPANYPAPHQEWKFPLTPAFADKMSTLRPIFVEDRPKNLELRPYVNAAVKQGIEQLKAAESAYQSAVKTYASLEGATPCPKFDAAAACLKGASLDEYDFENLCNAIKSDTRSATMRCPIENAIEVEPEHNVKSCIEKVIAHAKSSIHPTACNTGVAWVIANPGEDFETIESRYNDQRKRSSEKREPYLSLVADVGNIGTSLMKAVRLGGDIETACADRPEPEFGFRYKVSGYGTPTGETFEKSNINKIFSPQNAHRYLTASIDGVGLEETTKRVMDATTKAGLVRQWIWADALKKISE